MRPSDLYNGNSYTVKMTSLYWDGPPVDTFTNVLEGHFTGIEAAVWRGRLNIVVVLPV